MTLQQYAKMSKPALIRKITKALRVMPKAKLARLCYNITKSKLPKLFESKGVPKWLIAQEKRSGRGLPRLTPRRALELKKLEQKELDYHFGKRKTKRKFSKKQLAAQRLFAKRAKAGTLRKRRR